MNEKLDMSLNDIIKEDSSGRDSKPSYIPSRPRGGNNFRGRNMRHYEIQRIERRFNKYGNSHGKFNTSFGNDAGQRLIWINNLHKGISNEDLRVSIILNVQKLFTKYGTMTKCGVMYDEMGYSTSSARVEFLQSEDAKFAFNELNGNNKYNLLYQKLKLKESPLN